MLDIGKAFVKARHFVLWYNKHYFMIILFQINRHDSGMANSRCSEYYTVTLNIGITPKPRTFPNDDFDIKHRLMHLS